MADLVDRLRAAALDERLSTGTLYREAAEEIEFVRAAYLTLLQQWQRRVEGEPRLPARLGPHLRALLTQWIEEDLAQDTVR